MLLKKTLKLIISLNYKINLKNNFSSSTLINCYENHLEITFNKSYSEKFLYFWLRDHCRCEKCVNTKTFQKSYHIIDVPLNIIPKDSKVVDQNLEIFWKDDHKSVFPLEWLKNIKFPSEGKREYFYWNESKANEITDNSISLEEIKKDENKCAKTLLTSLLKYGFAFIKGVDPTIKATEEAISRFFPPKKTYFGEMYKVTSDFQYNDTAYTNVFLAPHTDNTYWCNPSGLINFHMICDEFKGGETLLMDGFNAANNLRIKQPELYKVLKNEVLESEYVEEGVHFTSVYNVIEEHPLTNQLWRIKFNTYDRAVLTSIPSSKILQFYKAYSALGEETMKTENILKMKLSRGTVLLVDNWRVMHGRNSFEGKRMVVGCYVSRDDWLSKAKHLGLSVF